jgi:hypothetical protein
VRHTAERGDERRIGGRENRAVLSKLVRELAEKKTGSASPEAAEHDQANRGGAATEKPEV